MTGAQTKDTAHSNGSRVQVMIQCRIRQWTSGLCKDRYCEGCVNKEECFEILGR
ncbi:hypothetical protein ES703_44196 [subsurface metagenome]